MQKFKDYLILNLPDGSVAMVHSHTLAFRQVSADPSSWRLVLTERPFSSLSKPTDRRGQRINPVAFADFVERPPHRFGDSFRCANSDRGIYSPKQSVHKFDLGFLPQIYPFGGSYQGGCFTSSTTQWHFLDGGIRSQNGYGFGSHSWTVVEGREAVRAVCPFFGIQQPLRLKGEIGRRPLATLLEELSAAPRQNAPINTLDTLRFKSHASDSGIPSQAS
jgi:hypothetical protein